MVLLIILNDSSQNLNRLSNRRLIHADRLETTFKRGILFDILAVFGKGGCTDYLNFTTGKRRFENIRSAHRAFRVTSTDEGMYLIDKQDNITLCTDFVNQSFNAALKLSSELGTRNQCGHIQQIDFLIQQTERYISRNNLLSNSFRNCRFTDTGFTNQTGIILLTAGQNLFHPVNFLITTDNPVHLATFCLFIQIDAEIIKIFSLLFIAVFGSGAPFSRQAIRSRLIIGSRDNGISRTIRIKHLL